MLDEQQDQREREREQLAKERAVARADQIADLQFMLNDPRCVRVLSRILDRTHFMQLSFNPDNIRLTDFREGESNIGKWLMTELLQANTEKARQIAFPVILAENRVVKSSD